MTYHRARPTPWKDGLFSYRLARWRAPPHLPNLTSVRRGVCNKCDDHAHFAPITYAHAQTDCDFTAQPFTRQKVLPKTSSSHLATSRSIFDRRGPLWCSGIIIGRVYYRVVFRLTGTYKEDSPAGLDTLIDPLGIDARYTSFHRLTASASARLFYSLQVIN